jgi:hypothetical protein
VFPIKNMANSFLEVDEAQDLVSVIRGTCCVQDNFENLGHFEKENIQAESFGYVYFFHLSIDFHLSTKVVVLAFFEGGED